ncbi:unnamed protein product [Peronospora destructor]|uniref:Uncharacterized protein n=1 Tax=Peronospora destructor TaxID=86335 RepID=A0AAV0U3S5_9STRA|nr:unnamed protein product [Peronospora destructor]
MDPVELKEKLQNLERQVATNPTDGPTRKRKQELEDTLRVVVKRAKGGGMMAEEERKKLADAPRRADEYNEVDGGKQGKVPEPREIYLLPPDVEPVRSTTARKTYKCTAMRRPDQRVHLKEQFRYLLDRHYQVERFQHGRLLRHLYTTRIAGAVVPPPPVPATAARDSSSIIFFYPATVVAANDREMESSQAEVDMDENDVVAPYPTTDEPEFHDSCTEEEQKMDEEAATRAAALCSLVPVALRVQRRVPAPSEPPVPRPTMPSIDVLPGPPPRPTNLASNSSLSNEFNTFMEEVKDLLD